MGKKGTFRDLADANPVRTSARRSLDVCHLTSNAKRGRVRTGSAPESEGAAGVRGQRGGRHDDHVPDLPDGPVREPAHV